MQEADAGMIEQVRTLQLHRLDDLLQKLYPKLNQEKLSEANRLRIVDRILRIERLRAKIAGTEAARKIDVGVTVNLIEDPEEVKREQEAWANSGGDVIDVPDSDIEDITPAELAP